MLVHTANWGKSQGTERTNNHENLCGDWLTLGTEFLTCYSLFWNYTTQQRNSQKKKKILISLYFCSLFCWSNLLTTSNQKLWTRNSSGDHKNSLLAESRLVGKLKVKTNNNSTLLKIRPWYAHVHTTLSFHHMLFRENTHMQKLQIQICFYG